MEFSIRPGTQRSITVGEGWAPLSQGIHGDDVLYTDMRFMGDNQDNNEGNIGLGYRRVVPKADAVLGGHIWFDRRRTALGSISHQITTGAEYLGQHFDILANAYMPLDKARHYTTGGNIDTTPFLANSGIYYNATGEITEEPLHGFDLEFGIPIQWSPVDNLKLYGGIYSFYGDETPDINGVRFRARADINPAISVGTRLQSDNIRGNQAFAEMTIRFPFNSKLSHVENALRARLDEAPERDIDIVTNNVTVAPSTKPVLNSNSGTAQNVIYVDNTASAGGNGSLEHPYNTLAAAQTAIADNDVLYIAYGDGTSTGQDVGLTIDKSNVAVIGAGVNFVWDGARFSASGSSASSGTVLKAATSSPLISNANNNALIVSGANTYLAGFSTTSTSLTSSNGIYAVADNKNLGTLTIDRITSDSNTSAGIYVYAKNAGSFSDVNITNITASNNGSHGVRIESDGTGSSITSTKITNITTNNNSFGTYIYANNAGSIDEVTVDNAGSSNNTSHGIYAFVQAGSHIGTYTLKNSVANSNTNNGIYVNISSSASIDTININHTTSNSNGNQGIRIGAINTGTSVTNINLADYTSNDNTSHGSYIYGTNGSTIGTLTIDNSNNTNNGAQGIRVEAKDSGTAITSATLTGNTTNDNGSYGVHILANVSGDIGTATLRNATMNNNAYGLYAYALSGGTIGDLTTDNSTASNNSSSGFRIESRGTGSTINTASLSDNTVSNNLVNGTYILAQLAGQISTTTVTGNTITANNGNSINAQAATDGDLGTLNVRNNILNDNTGTGRGLYIFIADSGSTLTSANITGNTANNNPQHGIYLLANNSGAIANALIQGNTTTGNTVNGIFINDDTDQPFYVDLGGGTLGSTGQNRIYNNAAQDIRLDLDGAQLKAENNWWGVSTGLSGAEVTLDEASTIDATPFLTSDPVP